MFKATDGSFSRIVVYSGRSLTTFGMTGIIREDRGEWAMAATPPFPPLPLKSPRSLSFRTKRSGVRNLPLITGFKKMKTGHF